MSQFSSEAAITKERSPTVGGIQTNFGQRKGRAVFQRCVIRGARYAIPPSRATESHIRKALKYKISAEKSRIVSFEKTRTPLRIGGGPGVASPVYKIRTGIITNRPAPITNLITNDNQRKQKDQPRMQYSISDTNFPTMKYRGVRHSIYPNRLVKSTETSSGGTL